MFWLHVSPQTREMSKSVALHSLTHTHTHVQLHKCSNMPKRRWLNTSKSWPTVMDESRHPKARQGVPQHWQRETEMGILCVWERGRVTATAGEKWFLCVHVNKKRKVCVLMHVHAVMCVYGCVCVSVCVVLMSVVQRSRAEGDSDGEIQGKMGEREMSGAEKSGEEDNLVQSVVDDLRKKGRRERHHQRTGSERVREGSGVEGRGERFHYWRKGVGCLLCPRGMLHSRSGVTGSQPGKCGSCKKWIRFQKESAIWGVNRHGQHGETAQKSSFRWQMSLLLSHPSMSSMPSRPAFESKERSQMLH